MTERRRFFMMGNALVVGVVERLGKALEKIVENED
jgi:DNA (cytosine-5)-methyltransferase 1